MTHMNEPKIQNYLNNPNDLSKSSEEKNVGLIKFLSYNLQVNLKKFLCKSVSDQIYDNLVTISEIIFEKFKMIKNEEYHCYLQTTAVFLALKICKCNIETGNVKLNKKINKYFSINYFINQLDSYMNQESSQNQEEIYHFFLFEIIILQEMTKSLNRAFHYDFNETKICLENFKKNKITGGSKMIFSKVTLKNNEDYFVKWNKKNITDLIKKNGIQEDIVSEIFASFYLNNNLENSSNYFSLPSFFYEIKENEIIFGLASPYGGEDLFSFKDKQNVELLSITELKNAMLKITKSIYLLHKIGYVHLDLKPENILFSKNKIKILDFGHSFLLGNKNKYFIREKTLGSSHYSPPEILENKEKQKCFFYNKSTDIWTLGCIFVFLIAGFNPFVNFPVRLADKDDCFFFKLKENIKELLNGDDLEDKYLVEKIIIYSKNNIIIQKDEHNDFIHIITIVMSMLEINPTKRPTIKDILDYLTDLTNLPL
jgi:hypothetical protein